MKHWQAAARHLGADDREPWGGGWRLNAPPGIWMRHGDETRRLEISTDGNATAVRDGDAVHVDVGGQSLEFRLAAPPTVEEAARHATSGADGTSVLIAPMPGRVIAVRTAEGASVLAHQPVIVIEAMKMEHAVLAPIDGIIARLAVVEGQQVQRGDILGEVVAER